MTQSKDKQSLEAFLLDNSELAQLKAPLDEFNIFLGENNNTLLKQS
jgi:hypothetical protein